MLPATIYTAVVGNGSETDTGYHEHREDRASRLISHVTFGSIFVEVSISGVISRFVAPYQHSFHCRHAIPSCYASVDYSDVIVELAADFLAIAIAVPVSAP